MYAIRIRLKNLENYSVEYRVHRQYQGWESGYVADGDIAGKQSINSRIEGLKIRIVPKIRKTPQVIYRGYIDKKGYQQAYAKDDLLAGTENKGIGLNGIKIQLLYGASNSGIEYKVLKDSNKGKEWTNWISDGELAGFEENGKNIYAIRIRLKNMNNYSVEYKIHRKYQGWEKNYVSDGETIGLEYSDSRIEGIKIRIVKKINKSIGVAYSGFIDKKGYQERVGSGSLIGTENKGIGLNGIRIELRHAPKGLGIEYQGYVQGIGWQDLKHEGEYVGTEQSGKNLYGIRIRLTNTNNYSVQYRVHRQYVGWKDNWVSDGELAGVENTSSRIEGIQIRIVPKIHHRIIKIETPEEDNITGNKIKIKGWEISEDKDTIVKLYIDNTLIKTLTKKARQDVLDKYVIEKESILQNFGGKQANLKPGFEDEVDISNIKKGMHILTIKIFNNKNKYVAEYNKKINLYGNNYMGIDVSKYNGKVDWEKVKAYGVKFAIVRVGFRGYESGKIVEDTRFKENIENASKVGIKVGAYFFSQAINTKEGIEEADFTINTINKYGFSNLIKYPLFIDTEYSGANNNTGRADNLSKYLRTEICKAFAQRIKNKGFTPGVYASKYWLYDNIDNSQLNSYDIWLAHYMSNAPFEAKSDYNGSYIIWQYSSTGNVNGINGYVDMNISYNNY